MRATPDVLNHNVETVPRLYPTVRPGALYERSRLLRRAREIDSSVPTKSGLMLGLGESDDEIRRTLEDLVSAGCMMLTLGQYLRPQNIISLWSASSPPKLSIAGKSSPCRWDSRKQRAAPLCAAPIMHMSSTKPSSERLILCCLSSWLAIK
jgi:hypothetical protein